MSKSRRRAREFALQGLYQWQLTGTPVNEIVKHLAEVSGFEKADEELFGRLLRGTLNAWDALGAQLAPHLDRPVDALSPVERAILLLATYELVHCIETPYRVVINEAIELAKDYGGTDGHRYVNGVLDKLAAKLRPLESPSANPQRPRRKPAAPR